jgi:hypothetical protein
MKDTIDMAREAGIKHDLDGVWCDIDQLEHLVELVRADQREIDAKICEYQEEYGPLCETPSECADAIRARGETK